MRSQRSMVMLEVDNFNMAVRYSHLHVSTLLSLLFSGDCSYGQRVIVEQALEIKGWIPDGSLLIMRDRPSGNDTGIRYRGIA